MNICIYKKTLQNFNSNSREFQLQFQLQLREFQLQLQLRQVSWISTPTPTPGVSTPTPTPANLQNINSNSNSRGFNSNSNSGVGVGVDPNSNSNSGVDPNPAWSQMSSREWRCSWSSADRRCSNYIWVIDNFIVYQGASYIRGFTVLGPHARAWSCRSLGLLFFFFNFQVFHPLCELPLQGICSCPKTVDSPLG